MKITALMAKPQLKNFLFIKSLVLVIDGIKNKKIGLILNKKIEEKASDLWQSINPNLVLKYNKNIRHGGPVYGSIILIHKIKDFADKKILENTYLTINTKNIENIIKKTNEYEMYVGYCTWASNQLELEIKNGFWWEIKVDEHMIFNNEGYWDLKKEEKNKEYLDSLGLKIQNHMLN